MLLIASEGANFLEGFSRGRKTADLRCNAYTSGTA